MKKYFSILCVLLLTVVSCDQTQEAGSILLDYDEADSTNLKVLHTQMSKDFRYLQVKTNLASRFDSLSLEDTSRIRIKATEYMYPYTEINQSAQPVLDTIVHRSAMDIKSNDLNLLVLADLSQPSSVIKEEQNYVRQMAHLYDQHNLFISFMLPGGDVTEIMEATPYVVSHYISSNAPFLEKKADLAAVAEGTDQDGDIASQDFPYLLRSLLVSLQRMDEASDAPFNSATKKVLVVLTDGQVFNSMTSTPIDPDHYKIQQKLLDFSHTMDSQNRLYFVNLNAENEDDTFESSLFELLATRSHGIVSNNLNWYSLSDCICDSYGITLTDYEMTFREPDYKIFMGNKRVIELQFSNARDSLLLKGKFYYKSGNLISPSIVGGNTTFRFVSFQVFVMGMMILLLAYLLMQFAIPYGLYWWFRRNYVLKYKGENMTYRSIQVPGTCYYCKAPFQVGDSIVVKCQHVVHEECWNENDYQCPEYGKHCPDGSHFYDLNNRFNPRNATFYQPWILCAILAATLAGTFTFLYVHDGFYSLIDWLLRIILHSHVLTKGNLMDQAIISPRLYNLPLIGVLNTFFLTFLLSMLAVHTRQWYKRVMESLVRTIVVSVVVLLAFFLEQLLVITAEFYDGMFFVDWIPWTTAALAITGSLFWHTRLKLRQMSKRLLYAAGVGVVFSVPWSWLADFFTVGFILLAALVNMLFSICIAVLAARQMPRHEHDLLHVTGPIKEMDIALYKWFSSQVHNKVTIGKSVDCSLHITWDIQSEIAPLVAELEKQNHWTRITAIDGEVLYNGKPLPTGKPQNLYHGDNIQIGQTIFTYIEE